MVLDYQSNVSLTKPQKKLIEFIYSLFVDMPPRLEGLAVPMPSSTLLELLPLVVLVTGTLARAELPLLSLLRT